MQHLSLAGCRRCRPFAQRVLSGLWIDPSPANGWRLFEVTTRVELSKAESAARV